MAQKSAEMGLRSNETAHEIEVDLASQARDLHVDITSKLLFPTSMLLDPTSEELPHSVSEVQELARSNREAIMLFMQDKDVVQKLDTLQQTGIDPISLVAQGMLLDKIWQTDGLYALNVCHTLLQLEELFRHENVNSGLISYRGRDINYVSVAARRVSGMITEVAEFALKEEWLRANAVSTATASTTDMKELFRYALDMPRFIFRSYLEAPSDQDVQSTLDDMPYNFSSEIFRYEESHPELELLSRTAQEFAMTVYMYRHRTDARFRKATEQLAATYEAVDQEMHENHTVDRKQDIARSLNLLRECFPGKSIGRMLFVGVGEGKAFEAPLVNQLQAEGVSIGQITTNDLRPEYGTRLPESLKKSNSVDEAETPGFVQGDITTPPVAQEIVAQAGHQDMVVAPWSLISDLITTDKVIDFLEALDVFVADGGYVVLDWPLVMSKLSRYNQPVDESSRELGVDGYVMQETEAPDGQTLLEIGNMLDPRVLQLLAEIAGFEIVNFLGRQEQLEIYAKIRDGEYTPPVSDNPLDHPMYSTTPDGSTQRITAVLQKRAGRQTDEDADSAQPQSDSLLLPSFFLASSKFE